MNGMRSDMPNFDNSYNYALNNNMHRSRLYEQMNMLPSAPDQNYDDEFNFNSFPQRSNDNFSPYNTSGAFTGFPYPTNNAFLNQFRNWNRPTLPEIRPPYIPSNDSPVAQPSQRGLEPMINKPAIYLYTKEDNMSVQVKLPENINLAIDIPRYHAEKGWNILANQNGELIDMQPEYTSLEEFPFADIWGCQYSLECIKTKSYPYLYWDGFIPNIESISLEKYEGFIINKENSAIFLANALEQMNLSEKEQLDFSEYWLPLLQNHNTNYLFITFIFTEKYNEICPLNIIPKPDNMFRMLMRIQGLDELPEQMPIPQKIEKAIRDNYYIIDWGGYVMPSIIKQANTKNIEEYISH